MKSHDAQQNQQFISQDDMLDDKPQQPAADKSHGVRKTANVLTTRGYIVFPNTKIKINVGRKASLASIDAAIKKEQKQLIVVAQIQKLTDFPTEQDLYKVGTLCDFVIEEKDADGALVLVLTGVQKVALTKLHANAQNYFEAEYEPLTEDTNLTAQNEKDLEELIGNFYSLLSRNEFYPYQDLKQLLNDSEAKKQSLNWLPLVLNLPHEAIQTMLEQDSLAKKIQKLFVYSADSNFTKKIDESIAATMNANISKQQKEYYLREKIRVIKEELGDIASKDDELDRLREIVKTKPYPKNIKTKVLNEINKMETFNNPNEFAISRNYVECLLDLPFWQKTNDNNNLAAVEKVLNQNHFGLEKVKERIVEYLAVKMKSPKAKGSIICLVGPPGVGKTSLVESIAMALQKKFVKTSLGGMRDESELKGHRKTYVGAMPGRIIKAMIKAKVTNPVFLFDEIDKISNDQYRGDPASVLLDILDPQQNGKFSDNYVEEEYDLSNVLFIATANYEENILEPLRDRLEIIRLSSYTENEKLMIAKNHLVPKILQETTVKPNELVFEDEALSYIIKRYTREAGVRETERCIRKIVRKFIVRQQKEQLANQTIDVAAVRFYLQKELFDYTKADVDNIPGVVNGMAYTSFGGDLLPIEANYSKGKGKINITGNLKETMRESVNVALGYIKANAEKFHIDPMLFGKIDLHIHVPSGGVPKDGPSAGIALTTAILSALKNVKIPSNVAMTGEITLRGKILIIGGVKEKTISAFRGGANQIFMPKEDERYLEDIPIEVRNQINITLVESYEDVYQRLFGDLNTQPPTVTQPVAKPH